MIRKIVLCLLVVFQCVLVFPNVFGNEGAVSMAQSTPGLFSQAPWMGLSRVIHSWNWRPQTPAPVEEPVIQEEPEPVKFRFSDVVVPVAEKHGMDWRLVKAVMEVESSCNPKAVSNKGAMGLMQVLPTTAALYKVKKSELFDPKRNIEAGVQHLKMLHERYEGNLELVLAAYNSGEGVVDRYKGVPPYKATRAFVKRVMNRYIMPEETPDFSEPTRITAAR